MQKKETVWSRYKPYAIALAIFVWGCVVFGGLTINPSVAESRTKLSMMKTDMDALKKQGGQVLAIDENAKFGGAILLVTFHDEGWSSDLVRRYEEALLFRNWKKVEGSSNRFCKNGVLAKIVANAGMRDGHVIHSVNMVFNSATIEQCAQKDASTR